MWLFNFSLCLLFVCFPLLLAHPDALEGHLSTLLSLECTLYPCGFVRTSLEVTPSPQSSLCVFSSFSFVSTGSAAPSHIWSLVRSPSQVPLCPWAVLCLLHGHPFDLQQALDLSWTFGSFFGPFGDSCCSGALFELEVSYPSYRQYNSPAGQGDGFTQGNIYFSANERNRSL